jgi:DNA-binding MarR family transcriptional regulator
MASRKTEPAHEPSSWTFLTNHAHVLLCLSSDPEMRLRDVASRVGITERAVQRIVVDLEEGGYVQKKRVGRRNQYRVRRNVSLRHPLEAHRSVSVILDIAEAEPRRKR